MKFNLLSAPGYWMVRSLEDMGSGFQHCVGGVNNLIGSISPNSGRPLLQLAQLDTQDKRLGLANTGLPGISLLFSWT